MKKIMPILLCFLIACVGMKVKEEKIYPEISRGNAIGTLYPSKIKLDRCIENNKVLITFVPDHVRIDFSIITEKALNGYEPTDKDLLFLANKILYEDPNEVTIENYNPLGLKKKHWNHFLLLNLTQDQIETVVNHLSSQDESEIIGEQARFLFLLQFVDGFVNSGLGPSGKSVDGEFNRELTA